MVKTRHSRDQTEPPANNETSKARSTSRHDPQMEHQLNGYQSDSSQEEQPFISRKRRRSYHEDSEDSSNCGRRRSCRVRHIDSAAMRPSLHRYYERGELKLRSCNRSVLGIRRSTRQKKLMYESYNQNLIDKQLSMMDHDHDSEELSVSERVTDSRRSRQTQSYFCRNADTEDEDTEEEEEDEQEDNKEEKVKMKSRSRILVEDSTAKNSEEEGEGKVKDTSNIAEGTRIRRRGRKCSEVQLYREEDVDDIEQPKRSHRRLEVEPMPEAEALDMYTRVKRERPRVKRDMYGIPINDDEKDEKSTSDSETEDHQTDEDSGNNSSQNKEKTTKNKSYNLRLHCRKTNLYSAPPIEPQRSHARSLRSFQSLRSSKNDFRSPLRRRRKRAAFHSSTSSSSATDDEEQFERRKSKSMAKARQRCLPMNLSAEDVATGVVRDRIHSGASLADVEPMAIDKSVLFDSVGGLGKHLQALKEMIVFPLLYPEVFTKFKIAPPRGVLFYGPPGTGKTLVARALANECGQGDTRVAFFMRKGADCLSKWVGESERQLRLLFDQAYQMRPAIIFFDEIDGLAPVRSSRQDQIHSSIVSTLLALMDGLDNRGEVVVIGATNRIDSIDPALRRPGRFDREFLFPLPSLEARKQILLIHTKEWNPSLATDFVADLAQRTVGYCGADLKALCTEAALHALRRRYPQIYNSRDKLLIDVSSINIHSSDFYRAVDRIVPTAQRSTISPAKALGSAVHPLLQDTFAQAVGALQKIFPSALQLGTHCNASVGLADDDFSFSDDDFGHDGLKEGRLISSSYLVPSTFRPRLLLAGDRGQGQSSHLGPALLHSMENLAVNVIDLPTLFAVGTRTPEEACAWIIREARRNSPSILYIPHINELWDVTGDAVRATFLTLLQDLDSCVPVLLLATSDIRYDCLPLQVKELFSEIANELVVVHEPDEVKRKAFFENLLLHQASQQPTSRKKTKRKLEVLPKAPKPEPRQLTAVEHARLFEQEETTLRELRLFLRDVINKLGRDRKFAVFAKPVDVHEVPDYYEIIKNPMDLSMMMTKIDLHKYETVVQFLQDIDLICSNALEYNPDKDPQDRAIRHRACALKDTTNAIIAAELDPDFGKLCEDITKARLNRGYSGKEVAVPSFYFTKPLDISTSTNTQAENSQSRCGRRSKENKEANDGAPIPESETNSTSRNAEVNEDNYPRKVIKKIRFCRTRKTSPFKSPWCRTNKRIYKKVVVYVDRDGKEVPESEIAKLSDCRLQKSDDSHELKESAGQLNSDILKPAGSGGSGIQLNTHATRCQGKRRSSTEPLEDSGRLVCEVEKLPSLLNNKMQCLSSNHFTPGAELGSESRPTADLLLPEKATVGAMAHDHQTRKAVQTLARALKTVVTDMPRLKSLLDQLVKKTYGFHVDRLEKLYSQLSLCIYRHRSDYDKMPLLKELESIVGNISAMTPTMQKRPFTTTTQDLSI